MSDKIKKFLLSKETVIFLIIATAFGIALRVSLFDYQSGDFKNFLNEWFISLKANGGIFGLGQEVGDYTQPYILIMALLTYIPLPSIVLIKIVSCIGDLFLAIYVKRIADTFYPKKQFGNFAYVLIMFFPTVVLNSAMWAQCDGIYVAALVACLYYFLKNRPFAAMIAYGIAFAFKLQAIFLAPFILVLLLKGKVKFRYMFIVPAIYIVGIIPSAIMGRNFFDLLTIYLHQTKSYSLLSLGCANIYWWVADFVDGKEFVNAAVIFAAMVTLTCVYFIARKKSRYTNDTMLLIALFFALLMPFVLPRMHERYFYCADILMILYCMRKPKQLYMGVMQWLTSLYVYVHYFFNVDFIDRSFLGIMTLANILLVARALYSDLQQNSIDENDESDQLVTEISEHTK